MGGEGRQAGRQINTNGDRPKAWRECPAGRVSKPLFASRRFHITHEAAADVVRYISAFVLRRLFFFQPPPFYGREGA